MRPNIVTEAGVQTRVGQWWNAIPFLTSSVVVVCGLIYLICLLTGYDTFYEVCFLPSAIISRFQVYRFYAAIIFHGSMLHVLFNMMALVPMGSELERIMGSVRLLYLTILLATTNAVLHLLIASLAGYNPFYQYDHLMNECAIGFSGVLFSMIVIETSLSGVTSRSVFGLFNVPAKLYPWILLLAFQLLMTNVSLLGHLCGILSGISYSYGLFNLLMPGSSFFTTIESASWMSSCVRRPKFIMCTGGNPSSYMPTYSTQNTTSSGFSTGNAWRSLSSWLPQRETSNQSSEDSRFPGRGRTLSTARDPTAPAGETDPNLHARLLEDGSPDRLSDSTVTGMTEPSPAARQVPVANPAVLPQTQGRVAASEEQIQKLVAMGFERTQVEVALAAADDDLTVAVEILMSQQGINFERTKTVRIRAHYLSSRRLLAYANGYNGNYLSLYLEVADSDTLPPGWRRFVKLRLCIVNQILEPGSLVKVTHRWFDEDISSWGFHSMIPLTKLHDEKEGFLANGDLVVVAEVDVLEVIGTLDESEDVNSPLKKTKRDDEDASTDVYGCQVLPSQVESVRCVFERHPDIAIEFRAKNQYLRKSCMSFLLSLIETLCESLEELSNEDLVEADIALTYVKDAGFKVDWLEKKLDQVKAKKEREQSSLVRLGEIQDSLTKLKQKCSDLDALMEEEKVELSAIRSPLSFDDVV